LRRKKHSSHVTFLVVARPAIRSHAPSSFTS
jgi:hypothetical protein